MEETEAFCIDQIQRILSGRKCTFKNKILLDLFKRAADEVVEKAGTKNVTVNGVTIYKKKSTKQYVIHIRWTLNEDEDKKTKKSKKA